MISERLWLLLLVSVVVLPVAQAAGGVDATVDGGRGPCGAEALANRTVGCVLEQEGKEVDLRQRNLSVSVTIEEAFWTERGLSPPTREPASIDGSSVSVPNPLFSMAEAVLDGRAASHPLAAFVGANMTREEYDYWYYGPSLREPGTSLGQRHGTIGFGDDWVGHDRLGPFDDIGGTTTEEMLDQYQAFTCAMSSAPDCHAHMEGARAWGAEWTPDITFGLDIGGAVADPAGGASAAGASGERVAGGALPARMATPFAPPSLAPPLQSSGSPLPPLAGMHTGPKAPPLPDASAPPPMAGATVPREVLDGTSGLPRAVATVVVGILLVLAALYARIQGREAALRSERRLTLVKLLHERGPMPIAALARASGVDRTTIEHHVRVLERAGEVRSRREGRMIYVFLPGQAIEGLPGAPRPTEELVLQALEGSGGVLERRALVEQLPQVAARTRNHALSQLVKRGVVRVEFDGYAQRIIRL